MKKLYLLFLIITSITASANDTLTVRQVYNFSVGDTFEYKFTDVGGCPWGCSSFDYYIKTVIQKNTFATSITYVFAVSDGSIDTLVTPNLDSSVFSLFTEYNNCLILLDSADTTTYPGRLSISKQQTSCGLENPGHLSRFTYGLGQTDTIWSVVADAMYPTETETVLIYYSNGVTSIGTPHGLVSSISNVANSTSSFVIYPAVANKDLSIATSEANTHYDVFDLNGRKLLSGITQGEKTLLNVNDFSNGMYLLQVINPENQQATKKFIIQH